MAELRSLMSNSYDCYVGTAPVSLLAWGIRERVRRIGTLEPFSLRFFIQ